MADAPHHFDAMTTPDGLHASRRWVGPALIITVAGELDLSTAPALRTAVIDGLNDPRAAMCVLDLTAVTFLASAGLAALIEATEHATRRRELLRIVVDANRPVIRPIEVIGLDYLLALCHTVDEALTAGHHTAEN